MRGGKFHQKFRRIIVRDNFLNSLMSEGRKGVLHNNLGEGCKEDLAMLLRENTVDPPRRYSCWSVTAQGIAECACRWQPAIRCYSCRAAKIFRVQERKRHVNSTKILGTPAGCLWDTGRVSVGHPAGQTGVYRPVPWGFPVVCCRRSGRKGFFFAGAPGRVCQGHRAVQGFHKLCVFYLMCLFCSLRI